MATESEPQDDLLSAFLRGAGSVLDLSALAAPPREVEELPSAFDEAASDIHRSGQHAMNELERLLGE